MAQEKTLCDHIILFSQMLKADPATKISERDRRTTIVKAQLENIRALAPSCAQELELELETWIFFISRCCGEMDIEVPVEVQDEKTNNQEDGYTDLPIDEEDEETEQRAYEVKKVRLAEEADAWLDSLEGQAMPLVEGTCEDYDVADARYEAIMRQIQAACEDRRKQDAQIWIKALAVAFPTNITSAKMLYITFFETPGAQVQKFVNGKQVWVETLA